MCYYIIRTSKGVRDAAIAQQVERILGKDEVTSSNLVSSLAVTGSAAKDVSCYQLNSYFEVWLSLARAPR